MSVVTNAIYRCQCECRAKATFEDGSSSNVVVGAGLRVTLSEVTTRFMYKLKPIGDPGTTLHIHEMIFLAKWASE